MFRKRTFKAWLAAIALLVGLVELAPTSSPATAQSGAGGWTITTVAGIGTFPFSGDGGPATAAGVGRPSGVLRDSADNLFISDASNRVRKVDPSGTITTVAGNGSRRSSGDGGRAISAGLNPAGLALDDGGNLYIVDSANNRVRKVVPGADGEINGGSDEIITTVAGPGPRVGPLGDGGPATSARLGLPQNVTLDAAGALYIADWNNQRIRKVVPGDDKVINGGSDEIITTVAGTDRGFSGDGGPASVAQLSGPTDMEFNASGTLYIVDGSNHRIRKVVPGADGAINGGSDEVITTVAGNAEFPAVGAYGGDGGPATSAQLNRPNSLAVQGGNLLIADTGNNRIRRVDASGTIDTVAGAGAPGFGGDGGFAQLAQLNEPIGVAFDDSGNLYIADTGNHRVRRLETSYVWVSSPSGIIKVGEQTTYTVSVSGLPATANAVELTAQLDPSMTLGGVTASQGSCTPNGGTVTCQLGSIDPGTTAAVQIAATAREAGIIPVIAATVSSQDPDAIPGTRAVTAHTKISAADCGRVVTANTVLSEDLGPCEGNGIIVRSDAVTLDLGGHRVFGFGGPGDGTEAGIRLPLRTGVTVANGTVSDFDAGVLINQGASNTVSNLTVRDNIGPDDPNNVELGDGIVLFDSSGNFILNNVVTHNGIFDGIGVLGFRSHNNTIERNTVQETAGPADTGFGFGQGIILSAPALRGEERTFITGNMVNRNVVRRNASAGISSISNAEGNIMFNTVENNGLTNGPGNGIGLQVGRFIDAPITHLVVQGNEVHGNSADGIHIGGDFAAPDANQILNNNAANNGQLDLYDKNTNCAKNVWRNNRWGSGGYNQDCVTLGGLGPRSKPKPAPQAGVSQEPPIRRTPSSP